MFFGLQLRHPQEVLEDPELVTAGELGQFANSLGDEGCGLIRSALPIWLLAAGLPLPARSCALPAAAGPGQKNCIQIHLLLARNPPTEIATLGRISELFRYKFVSPRPLFNICRFDRGRLTTHVRFETVGRESRGTHLNLFP